MTQPAPTGAATFPADLPSVAFFGSPPFATAIFRALLEGPFPVLALVTQPERPTGRGRKPVPSAVVELAETHGVRVLRPESARDSHFVAQLKELGADVFLVASYGEILTQEVLDLPRRCPLNVHGSLLPRWRGASPVQAAILAGDEGTGVSIQRMVRALDAGDLLVSRATGIGPRETAGELSERLSQLGAQLSLEALDLVARGRAVFTPQDPAGVTHCTKIPKSAGWIDWSQSASQLDRHVRAYTPWPGARSRLEDGRELTITRARPFEEPTTALAPGCVHGPSLGQGRLVVGAGTGALELLSLLPAGKRELSACEWLRGARLSGNERFATPHGAG